MKRNILLAFLLLSTFHLAIAQATLSFTPETIVVEDEVDTEDNFAEVVGYATVTNDGDEDITIRWVRYFEDVPEDWSIQVCDLNLCYSPIVYSNISDSLGLDAPVTLAPGESTNMDVHARPMGIAGTATVRIEVADANTPDNVLASGTYELTAAGPTSTREAFRPDISIFPNPATDYIQLNHAGAADRLVIYNIIGREMRSFNTAPGQRYYIGDLPNGMYLASLVSRKKGVLTTLRVQKSALRP